MVMDSKPFGDLHHILQETADERVWVFAEWVSNLCSAFANACLRSGSQHVLSTPAALHRLALISHQKSMGDGQQGIMSVFTISRTMPLGVSRVHAELIRSAALQHLAQLEHLLICG